MATLFADVSSAPPPESTPASTRWMGPLTLAVRTTQPSSPALRWTQAPRVSRANQTPGHRGSMECGDLTLGWIWSLRAALCL